MKVKNGDVLVWEWNDEIYAGIVCERMPYTTLVLECEGPFIGDPIAPYAVDRAWFERCPSLVNLGSLEAA